MESGEISSMYFSMPAGGEYFDGFAEDLEGFQWLQPVVLSSVGAVRAFFDATSLPDSRCKSSRMSDLPWSDRCMRHSASLQ
jgi:hypothetical protein